jgi:putative SOS response-associated peptidase YedK
MDRGETERLPLDLLRPFEASEMEMHKANPKVNSVRNNAPEMLDEGDLLAEPGELSL